MTIKSTITENLPIISLKVFLCEILVNSNNNLKQKNTFAINIVDDLNLFTVCHFNYRNNIFILVCLSDYGNNDQYNPPAPAYKSAPTPAPRYTHQYRSSAYQGRGKSQYQERYDTYTNARPQQVMM